MKRVEIALVAEHPTLKKRLVAQEQIHVGDAIVACSPGEITPARTFRTIQIAFNQHLKNHLIDYVDHSCAPNSVFDVHRLTLVALRSIAPGESITFFYPGSEVELASDFHCACESPSCIGHVRGGFYLTRQQMRWSLDHGFCTRFMEVRFKHLLEFHGET